MGQSLSTYSSTNGAQSRSLRRPRTQETPTASTSTPVLNGDGDERAQLGSPRKQEQEPGKRSFSKFLSLSRRSRRAAPSSATPETTEPPRRSWLSRTLRGKKASPGPVVSTAEPQPPLTEEPVHIPDESTLPIIPDDERRRSTISTIPTSIPDIDTTESRRTSLIAPARPPTPAPPVLAPLPEEAPASETVQPARLPQQGTLVVVQGIVQTTDILPPAPVVTPPRPPAPLRPPNAPSRRRGRGFPSPEETFAIIDAHLAARAQAEAEQAPPPPTQEEMSEQLSRSNIEVLGTLLSVATAATAASLVTGSTEPLFQTGLAGPTQQAPQADRGRMRNAFVALRDRMRPGRGRDEQANPGELLFAEMARALNASLAPRATPAAANGAPASGTSTPRTTASRPAEDTTASAAEESTPPATSESTAAPTGDAESTPRVEAPAAPAPTSPPGAENSFERFLHNLQVDLRVALAEDMAARRSRPPSALPTPVAQTPATENPPVVPAAPEPSAPAATPSRPGSPAPSIGSPAPSASAATPAVSPITPEPSTTTSPGINWWRLYRFPPMRAQAPAAAQDAPTTTSGATASMPASDTAAGAASAAAPAAEGTMIVPVIVVGLQSVANERTGAPFPAFPGTVPPPPAPTAPTLVPAPASEEDRLSRTWSRALNRIGGRSSSTPPPTTTTPPPAPAPAPARGASRTYLIYVIGGYYPPNHSIVTGGAELNSFEALWDLAELLGQVKPPVASKDEIAKSGLVVLKAKDLASHTVQENTTERCLVCLDEYEAEDEVRLMSCKHAFHKACVDRWLEQGRNNCPACRTKGVRVDGDEEPIAPQA